MLNKIARKEAEAHWKNMLRTHSAQAKKPLIVILGATASGKTAFSITAAEFLRDHCRKQAEIVNADSRQLYRFLDIGTAKIAEEERQGIPHHLLSRLDPKETATIAWYKEQAARTIDKILARGHIPLLVGGSMLYISSIIDGLEPLPAPDAQLRARLERDYEHDGGETLHRRLQVLDPESATVIPSQNKQYLVRACEIAELTGRRPSRLKRRSFCPYDVLTFGLAVPRREILARINERIEQMFARGWIEEVHSLLARGYTGKDPAMESHGYQEITAFLREKNGNVSKLKEQIAARTRQYAKKQITWWKKNPGIHWVLRT